MNRKINQNAKLTTSQIRPFFFKTQSPAAVPKTWNDENVQVYTITTTNKVTSKRRVIAPTETVKGIIYECY